MDRSQHYSLRWNNHQHHLLAAFDALLQNESLVDCTIMCEDSAVRAHRVVLSACSPYFQKIFIDNPGKHPIVVLKDVLCWEMQCILDFMYKGETSVPEPQLTSLIKAAESLKVRGLTSDQHGGGLPPGVSLTTSSTPTNLSGGRRSAEAGGYRSYSPSPSPSSHHHHRYSEPSGSKMMAHNLSSGGGERPTSPLSLLTPHHHHHHHHNGGSDHLSDRASGGRASPLLLGGSGSSGGNNCPRRKQARPRRRSGDSVNSSLDLSKAGSPPLSYSTSATAKRESPPSSLGGEDHPENLSLRRSHSPPPPPPSSHHHHHGGHHHGQQQPPAINLVKMEQLVETERRMDQDNISDSSLERDCDSKPLPDSGLDRNNVISNGIHHLQEQEALQALNFMASGGGMPPHHLLPPPGVHSPLHGLPPHHFPPLALHKAGSLTPGGGNPNYPGRSAKGQHSAPRGGPPRSWTNDDLTKALENVWNKRMTTSQASRVFGIPYNSLLMYVRGKYGKSLRLDVLKKNTPAANDNLNTIGNSRSTPKEKGLKKEAGGGTESSGLKREDWLKERGGRKSSHHHHHHHHPEAGGPMSSAAAAASLFNFDPAGLSAGGGPFGGAGGMLHFPPLGEPLGLLGLGMPAAGQMRKRMGLSGKFAFWDQDNEADSRIKDLMQSLQSQQAALAHNERVKEELFPTSLKENLFLHTKENQENNLPGDQPPPPSHHFGLASLLMRAKDLQQQQQQQHQQQAEEEEELLEEEDEEEELEEEEDQEQQQQQQPPKKAREGEEELEQVDDEEEDMEAEEAIPQIAIKPLEVVRPSNKGLELSMPPPTNEISAQ